MNPRISLIAALSENRVIGINNTLPWHIPGDLKRFKELTNGHPIIMGRKTFESLGRKLPNRTNIVVTRDGEKLEKEFAGNPDRPDIIASSLEDALTKAKEAEGSEDEIFIIGGGQIFEQALPLADRLYLTLVHTTIEGDAYFPDYSEFKSMIASEDNKAEELQYTYLTLER